MAKERKTPLRQKGKNEVLEPHTENEACDEQKHEGPHRETDLRFDFAMS